MTTSADRIETDELAAECCNGRQEDSNRENNRGGFQTEFPQSRHQPNSVRIYNTLHRQDCYTLAVIVFNHCNNQVVADPLGQSVEGVFAKPETAADP